MSGGERRFWGADPTGRHPYRAKVNDQWTEWVSAAPDGKDAESDREGADLLRSAEPATVPETRVGARLVVIFVILLAVLIGYAIIFDKSDNHSAPTDRVSPSADLVGAQSFSELVESGASCQELYAARNELDSYSRKEANASLHKIGCWSWTSERKMTDSTNSIPLDSPSSACLDTMNEMGERIGTASDFDFARLNQRALTVCETLGKWYAAALEHPHAIGRVDDLSVDLLWLELSCPELAEVPVCVDARERGFI